MQTQLTYIATKLESADRQRRLAHMHVQELPARDPRKPLLARILGRRALRGAPSREPVRRAPSPVDLLR